MLILPLLIVPFWGISQSIERACFSVHGGFYEESLTLEIFPFYQQHHIRFTTNGNRPTAASQLYTEPLLLDESLYSTSDIYTIQITPSGQMFHTDSVGHCIVIRAAVFDVNDNCISPVSTNSYFIQSLGCDTHGLPVMSVCSDSLGLFDYYNGIMVPGVRWDSINSPKWTGNYFQKGMEWERVCNVEFYETDNAGINQIAGLRTHGGASRRLQQKGFRVYAREEYGQKRFHHTFFSENENLDSYKHLCLKPFQSSHWLTTGIQDQLAQQVARSLNVDALASRQMVLFLNGEYWGIYTLEESPDAHYFEDHYGIEPEEVNIIKKWLFLDEGDDTQWNLLYQWVMNADLFDEDKYNYMCEQIDIDNFIDYWVFELYSENLDWPVNNVRCWQHLDEPWRWVFFDGDGCFSRDWDIFAHAADTTTVSPLTPKPFESTLFFRKLFENHSFQNRFRNRFLELMSNQLQYSQTAPRYNAVCAMVQEEVPLQCSRFGFPSSVAKWEEDVNAVNTLLLSLNEEMESKLNRFMNEWNAVDDIDFVESFSCYPNPFQDKITLCIAVEQPEQAFCSVYDLLGRLMATQTLSLHSGYNTVTLDLSLRPGLYLLKVNDTVTKIMKQ